MEVNSKNSLEKQLEREIENSGLQLLDTICDTQDTFALLVKEDPEKTALEVVANALLSFSESNPQLISARPRALRDNDRVKLLPGQHGGISLQFGLNDGNLLRINAYGGLRGFSGEDMKDSDTTLRRAHDVRTGSVLSQPTQINLHIKRPDDSVLFELWIVYDLNQRIRLDKLSYEGECIDAHPVINSEDSRFGKLTSGFHKSLGTLVKLIPSA